MGAQVPSVAFVHIPPREFMSVWDDAPCNGSKGEPVCCPLGSPAPYDLIPTLRGAGVSAVFSGHDHSNDFEGLLPGGPGEPPLRLAYGRKSGGDTLAPSCALHVSSLRPPLRPPQRNVGAGPTACHPLAPCRAYSHQTASYWS
eukprot:4136266-Pyramimonas_sp.AAC.1